METQNREAISERLYQAAVMLADASYYLAHDESDLAATLTSRAMDIVYSARKPASE
jgi:hypothetical protein